MIERSASICPECVDVYRVFKDGFDVIVWFCVAVVEHRCGKCGRCQKESERVALHQSKRV